MIPRDRKFATTDEQGNFSDFFLGPLRRLFATKEEIPVIPEIPEVPTMQEIATSAEVVNTVESTAGALVSGVLSVATAYAGDILDARGPSWVEYGPDGQPPFPELLPPVLGFTTVLNRGRSGRRDQDNAQLMVDTTDNVYAWNTAFDGAGLIHGGNNLIEPDTENNRRAALEASRTMVALMSASSRIEQTGWTFRPNGSGQTWVTDSAQPYASGGTATIGFHDGLQVDIPVPAGTSYLLCHGTDTSAARGATLRIAQDGVEVAIKSLDGQTVMTPWEANNGVAPVVIRLPNLKAGIVTVTVDHAGLTGQVLAIIDALLPQSSTPRPIIMVKPVTMAAPTHNKPALLSYLRGIPDVVRAEFGNHVIVVDPETNWDPATMLGPDGLHPNVAGTIEHRDAIVSAVRAHVWQSATQQSLVAKPVPPSMQEIADSTEIENAITVVGGTQFAGKDELPDVPSMEEIAASTEIENAIGSVGGAQFSGVRDHEISAARFGVKGDGTDETAALQAFVNYLAANAAHGVIPFREVRISEPLAIPSTRGWIIRGMGRWRGTNITQITDNVPVLRMGVGGGQQFRDWALRDICINYLNPQPAANVNANNIFFEAMPYQFELSSIYLRNGYYGVGYQSGVGGAWGGDWDGLIFGGMSGGWINMAGTINSVPNNRFGRIYGDASQATDYLFKSFTGYNTTMDAIEVINHANGTGVEGNGIFDFTTGSSFVIGAFKLEGGRFTKANVDLVRIPSGCFVSFGEFRLQASNGGLTVTPSSGDCTIFALGTGGTAVATVDIGLLAVTATSTGFLNGYVAKGGTRTSQVFIKRMDKTQWKLTNRLSGALVSENMRIEQWMNKRLSTDKGNTSVTVTPGDTETTLFFETPFTAQRDVNIPSDSAELIGGLAYRIYVAANVVNGTNYLRIVCPGIKVVYVKQTATAEIITVEWRTTGSGAAGWLITGISPVG